MKRITRDTAEVAILERFLIAYSKRFGVELSDIVHRDKPDFQVRNPKTDEIIGIEVTGVYQNKREAKIQYSAINNWDRFKGSTEELVKSLNERLKDKSRKSKTYIFDGRMILALWLGSLVFNQKIDADFIHRQLKIGRAHV